MTSVTSARRYSLFSNTGWAIPAVLILVLQAAVYVWMAPRGFDFTDESYYFYNFLYWRDFTGTVSFFGAYFEWPFRAMGTSISGIRILSLVLVMSSGAVLMHYLLRFSMGEHFQSSGVNGIRQRTWCYLAAPMVSAMMYFEYLSTLRAPSYNLMSLFTIAVATACLLHTLERQDAGRVSRLAPLVYGLALGACFFSKATTAVLLVLVHALFFVAINRVWAWKRVFEIFLLILAGFAVNLALLTVEFPGWLHSLREGLELMRLRGFDAGAHLKDLSWDTQRALMRVGPWLVPLGLLLALTRRKLGPESRTAISLLSLVLVASSVLAIAGVHRTKLWLFVMAATALGLWSLELLARPGRRMTRAASTELALMALLFALPLVFSVGTDRSILAHSAIAALFVYCAVLLQLYRMSHKGLLTRGALAACVFLLCIPAAAAQWLAITNVRHTFNQLSPLDQQDNLVALGPRGSILRIDRGFGKSVHDIQEMARLAGFKTGQKVLDMTGCGPGAGYAIGATPLGAAWIIGGQPGSAAAAERIIERLTPDSLRGAWLLTSANGSRGIVGWEEMLAHRIGPGSHRLAGSIDVANPYASAPNEPSTINLSIWKPAARETSAR